VGGGAGLKPWQSFSVVIFVTVFAFFSMSTSKRGYYLLPIMPWAVLLLADVIRVCFRLYRKRMPGILGRMSPARLTAVSAYAMLVILGGFFLVGYPIMEKRRSARTLVEMLESETDAQDHLVK